MLESLPLAFEVLFLYLFLAVAEAWEIIHEMELHYHTAILESPVCLL